MPPPSLASVPLPPILPAEGHRVGVIHVEGAAGVDGDAAGDRAAGAAVAQLQRAAGVDRDRGGAGHAVGAAAAQLQRAAVDGGRAAVLVQGRDDRRAPPLFTRPIAAAAQRHVDRAGLDVVVVAAGGGQACRCRSSVPPVIVNEPHAIVFDSVPRTNVPSEIE